MPSFAPELGLPFDHPVPPSGYAWWYMDGISDCGRHAVTAIAFVGSVFSPWYFRARAEGPADPLQFAALNLSIRSPGGHLWVMNERAILPGDRSAAHLQLGPSSALMWEQGTLRWIFAESTKPFFQRMSPQVRGEIRLIPQAIHNAPALLDSDGAHHWCAVAPLSRFELKLTEPAVCFSGSAYHDANWGSEGLERAFSGWHWSRAATRSGTAVLYDTKSLDGADRSIHRLFRPDGSYSELDAAGPAPLSAGRWAVARATRSEDGRASILATLEDSPFYVRSLVQARWQGEQVRAVHESLDLRRFRSSWVRFLLPFRSRQERPRRSSLGDSTASQPRIAALPRP